MSEPILINVSPHSLALKEGTNEYINLYRPEHAFYFCSHNVPKIGDYITYKIYQLPVYQVTWVVENNKLKNITVFVNCEGVQ